VPPVLAAPSTPTITVASAPPVPPGAKISGIPGAQSIDDRTKPQKADAVTNGGVAPSAAEPATVAAAAMLGSTGVSIKKPYAKTPATKQDSPSHVAVASMPRHGAIEPVALTDASDSIETVVIPGSRSKGPGNISVRRDPAGVTPVSPTLIQAYDTLQRGDIARAKELYGQVLQGEPRNIDALLGLAAIASSDGRTDEASRYYQQVLEVDPRNSYAQAGLISIVGGADLQASETRLKQLIVRDPSAFLYFSLGNLYAEQRQWPAAQQAYYQAYQMQQDNPDYAFNLAIGLEHIGQNRLALDYYRKALDLSFKKGHANFDQSLVIQRVGQLSTRIEQ
jgi:tetratricopeptide (TPR) repeat protein